VVGEYPHVKLEPTFLTPGRVPDNLLLSKALTDNRIGVTKLRVNFRSAAQYDCVIRKFLIGI
jgi:hypothetical protein